MLRGENIYLRKVIPEDVDHILLWENDQENWKVSGIQVPYTYEEIVDYVLHQQDEKQSGQIRFMICDNETNEPLGNIDLFQIDFINMNAGVGVLIASKSNRRKGYAKESLKLLIEFCASELGFRNLFCSIHADNDSSLELFKNAGFEEIGLRKDWYLHEGSTIDEILFQLCLRK